MDYIKSNIKENLLESLNLKYGKDIEVLSVNNISFISRQSAIKFLGIVLFIILVLIAICIVTSKNSKKFNELQV